MCWPCGYLAYEKPRIDKDKALGVHSGSSHFGLLPLWEIIDQPSASPGPQARETCREDHICGITFSKHDISTYTERTAVLRRGGERTPPFSAGEWETLSVLPLGAGCGLSKPITSLLLPSAWGSTNLSQVSPWLPLIQQWIRREWGGI